MVHVGTSVDPGGVHFCTMVSTCMDKWTLPSVFIDQTGINSWECLKIENTGYKDMRLNLNYSKIVDRGGLNTKQLYLDTLDTQIFL